MRYTTKQRNEIFDKILNNISENKASLRETLQLDGTCNADTFYRWLEKSKKFRERYARATDLRHDGLFDEILVIARRDNADAETIDGKVVIIGQVVQRSKLEIDAIKWMLGKMNPTKYGDKVEVEHKGTIDLKQITGMEVT